MTSELRRWITLVDTLAETEVLHQMESRETHGVLYHGTSYSGLLAIFTSNTLRGYPTDVRVDGKIRHDGPPSVSLTRDLTAARSHAGKDSRKTEGGRVVLVFDRDRLARQYGRKLRPIDVLQIRGHSPDNPFTGVSEFEERLAGDITHVTRYITRVIVDDPESFNRFEEAAVAREPALAATFAGVRHFTPRLAEAARRPMTLYHSTLKSLIPPIKAHGLQPQQGKLWSGVPLVFAANRDQRQKLYAVMLQQLGHVLDKPMHKVTNADAIDHGAIAVITDIEPFQRAQGYSKPIRYLERGDYYTDQAVPVDRFMVDHEMAKFLAWEFRYWERTKGGTQLQG